ncbi:MAG: hypothetical protein OIN66_06990, partial [Candidatus Methanoperedens sp.]|nr:hypothetical protein [Candidatus Methanoperedens sp.]
MSGFDHAALLTVDGVGEKNTTTCGYAEGNALTLKECIQFPDSIGLIYTAITVFLGFKANDDEYKVMGLAPYGEMDKRENPFYPKLWKLVKQKKDGSFKL